MYLSTVAREQIRAAQATLDRHVVSSGDGRCAACGAVEDGCPQRRAALRLLGRYGLLPCRRPGATHPELITGPTAGGFGWFSSGRGHGARSNG